VYGSLQEAHEDSPVQLKYNRTPKKQTFFLFLLNFEQDEFQSQFSRITIKIYGHSVIRMISISSKKQKENGIATLSPSAEMYLTKQHVSDGWMDVHSL